jgi:hypothetical protein
MGMLANWKRKQALKRYASELPGRLSRDYGATTFFTRGQIATAIAKLKLDPSCSDYAYAMFLPEEDYHAGPRANSAFPSYDEARTEFARHIPPRQPNSATFYESGIGMTGGGGDGGGGGHGHGF